MTTESLEHPEYVPIGFDVAPSAPPGAMTTVVVFPPDGVCEVRGIRIYNRPGEIEISRLSYFESLSAPDPESQQRSLGSAVGPFDAADYNVELRDVDSVQEAASPRFCRVHWGLISSSRPVTITFTPKTSSSKAQYTGSLHGVLYGHRVVPGDPLNTRVPWREHPHFRRFLELSFETPPPDPACELIYYGWVGRGRAGL